MAAVGVGASSCGNRCRLAQKPCRTAKHYHSWPICRTVDLHEPAHITASLEHPANRKPYPIPVPFARPSDAADGLDGRRVQRATVRAINPAPILTGCHLRIFLLHAHMDLS